MYTNSKMMKESMLPHTGSWTLNEFIPIAGQAAADNIAPRLSQIQYAMRAPTLAMCETVFDVLDRNADHVAAMTHCTVTKAWITRDPRRPAEPRDGGDHLSAISRSWAPPQWSEEAKEFAREMQQGARPRADGRSRSSTGLTQADAAMGGGEGVPRRNCRPGS